MPSSGSAVLNARLTKRRTQLDDAQNQLVRARVRLSRLERKQATAEKQLAENLRENFKAGKPTFVTVVLNANGFNDLVSQFEFYRRIARRNASVLNDTRNARREVQGQTVDAQALRTTYAGLARDAESRPQRRGRDPHRAAQPRGRAAGRRAGVAARLASVQGRIAAIQRRQEAAARRARAARTARTQAPAPVPQRAAGGDVVGRVVAAANEIAGTPYVYGGGHGGNSGGYDCSGSISYALAAAGLLASPLDSTGFMCWGEAGPGKRITVYANAGHAFMVVDGRRFDTSALSGGGTRWSNGMRSTAGFVARHPPGL